MTKNQFDKLDRFDLKKFAKGGKVVVEFGADIHFPTEQRYFPGHPDPIVVKIDSMWLAYSEEYASKQMRMLPKERYQVRFQYPDESQKSMTWVVLDTKYGEIMGSFGTKLKEGAVKAGAYAKFLNDEDKHCKISQIDKFYTGREITQPYFYNCLERVLGPNYGEKAKVQDQYY